MPTAATLTPASAPISAAASKTTEALDLEDLAVRNAKRTRVLFAAADELHPIDDDDVILRTRIQHKFKSEFSTSIYSSISTISQPSMESIKDNGQLVLHQPLPSYNQSNEDNNSVMIRQSDGTRVEMDSTDLVKMQIHRTPAPKWHAPWKLMRVISGHLGWVRSVAVDTSNMWFATGSADRMVKIWDLASGTLKLSLTGHVGAIRGLAVSARHPYLFSAGEDKQIKCWDLETNKVIRQYHGHLSGVYSLALHPTLDILVSGGRDSVARVWDMRTRQPIHVLTGHNHTVGSILTQETDPQIITGSMDSTIRLWDLAAGKSMTTLTHHKKSVRALAANPNEFTFASGAADNIKQWKLPEGRFIQNCAGHRSIINTLSINQDNILFSGADDGSMTFWDYKSGHAFQRVDTTDLVQPGSMQNEAGVFCSTFDRSGTRLITGEADKTIKIWKQDETATEATHPIEGWKPSFKKDHY